ncbi:CBS-domain-containing protein [Gigaspora margarita]|uniref:CBS-domain-containing protein n=1 Tax=Gigaspora margarita TaxID=4874 RepID=A0A8H3X4E3_GIGMA|nr:CBS-domain-containing protein [Gigaspora margarita]
MSLKVPSSRQQRLSGETRNGDTVNINNSQDIARKRQLEKDERIRKKVEHDLTRTNKLYGKKTLDKIPKAAGSVGSLRPSPAITLLESATVMDAARFMAVSRATAVLVVDESEKLLGIVTDKDLAFRVCAEGLNPNATSLADIMTRDPDCVTTSSNASDALNRMVSGGYRHLPLLDDADEIIGLLDITECLFHALARLEKAHASTRQLFAVLDDVSDINALNKADFSTMASLIKQHLCFPRLSSIMDPSKRPPEVSIKTNVRDAARIMKEHHQTAVLVVDDSNSNHKTVGIFTTKDIVLRIYGQSVEPYNTSTVRIMTPCPDMVTTDTTILQALRQMQDERYQHLPVINGKKIIVGMVDILQLTYSTLNTLRTLNGEQVESGPVWNKFWNTLSTEDPKSEGSSDPMNETFMSSNSIDRPIIKQRPNSTILTPPSSDTLYSSRRESRIFSKIDDGHYIYKCKLEGSDQSHRFTSDTQNFTKLNKLIRSKMNIPEDADITISYIDEENDKIMLASDEDMTIAMDVAKGQKSPLIRLCVEVKSSELADNISRVILSDNIPSIRQPTQSQQFPLSESATAVTIGSFLSIGVAIGVGVMWAARSK